ncbi:UDP-N-acetylmuramate dehydrogenase [Lactococcus hircilactis]|uniref:UDP-N-acetylenolpyruvoylglucosamine reductase n=1 Tax=Lactococcus hircilactis TaxID=1494462 RepID=A0A7X1Z834_9LACT|nr:UDP-N-acetylmuramate dehydrogenase [Lactococcus hircilactis]MQW38461.1 UDP-N-acetylmuramate dehydrogenase [Lactococcus hircilactis]
MLDKKIFEQISDLELKYNEPLSQYTYTKVGGPADILAFPKTVMALEQLIAQARENGVPVTVLGNASNLIVRDGGIRGVVILLEKMNRVQIAGYTIEAQAGAGLIQVSEIAAAHALSGFEFACGIPGSIGGAVFMNAGAYGGEISEILASCKVIDQNGNLSVLTGQEMHWGYRQSIIREHNLIVVSAKFELTTGDPMLIKKEMEKLNTLRASKQPLEYPSCGSVFKRPAGHFAGQLIQASGVQGFRIGGVEVSKKHAGFMVNVDHAKALDYEQLIAHVIEKVKENSGITLECEVRIIGDK